MDKLSALKQIAMDNGCAFFGTSCVAENLPEGFLHLPYAITLGMRYPKTIIDGIKDGPTCHYYHHYRTINANLDRTAIQIESRLLAWGHEAVYVPASQSLPTNPFAALFSHKIAAVKAGLGFIGKNNLFIHTEFGPGVRLSTILTDLELPAPPESAMIPNACADCHLCYKACPAGAIHGMVPKAPYRVGDVMNAEKCSYLMKNKFGMIGRGSVCGICIAVCPFAR